MKQTLAHVNNLPKKPTIRDKTEPLGFQRMGLESGQPKVIGFKYLILPSIMRKCQSQHVLVHPKE
jgi:hypothetical protein